jgi:hypothetical protein
MTVKEKEAPNGKPVPTRRQWLAVWRFFFFFFCCSFQIPFVSYLYNP